jgi:hypothetical protein
MDELAPDVRPPKPAAETAGDSLQGGRAHREGYRRDDEGGVANCGLRQGGGRVAA